MNIIHTEVQLIKVQTERTIRVGQKVRMLSSYAFAGVEEGSAEVVEIVLAGQVSSAKYEKDIINNSDLLQDEDVSYNDVPWVVYRYLDGEDKGGIYTFPLELFLDHSHLKF